MWLWHWARSRSKRNELGIPIRNFGKVTDAIYRGALPDERGYRALARTLGVRRVCSVIEHERRADRERALASGMEEWRSIPFSDRDAPEPGPVKEWLNLMRSADKARPIFTHCRGGRHRTGILVGVYRVTDCGWTKERALHELMKYGWYAARGHGPLLEWFMRVFDPADYSPGAFEESRADGELADSPRPLV